MSLSKGHLGSRGRGSIQKQSEDTSFIYSMTNITILGVFRMHAPKEYGNDFCTYILNILALIFFETRNVFTQSMV